MRTAPALTILIILALAGVAAAQEFQSDPDNPVVEKQEPYDYVSSEGEFRVTWPGGCGSRLRQSTVGRRAPGESADLAAWLGVALPPTAP